MNKYEYIFTRFFSVNLLRLKSFVESLFAGELSKKEFGMLLQRLRKIGFGVLPDNTTITASIGIAERSIDNVLNWNNLVNLADQRMYIAKQDGRDRVFGINDISERSVKLNKKPLRKNKSLLFKLGYNDSDVNNKQ